MFQRKLLFVASWAVLLTLFHPVDSAVGQTPGPTRHSAHFSVFSADVARLNARYRHEEGYEHFVDIVEVSKSAVQLTAHERWIKAPLPDRQRSLNLMVNLWALRSGEEQTVTLLIVDARGIPVMKGSR